FVFVAFISVIIGIVGFNYMTQMKSGEEEIFSTRLPSIQTLLIMYQAQTEVGCAENALLVKELTPDQCQQQYTRINNAFERANEAWKTYVTFPQTPEEKKLWDQFVPLWQKWKKDDADYINMIQSYQINKSEDLYRQIVVQALYINTNSFFTSNDLLTRLVKINEDGAKNAHNMINQNYQTASIIMIVVIIIGALFALSLGIIISRVISKPIKQLVDVSGMIAQGNLTISIEVKRKDEIGILFKSFKNMQDNLKKLIETIIDNSESLAAATQQMSASTQQISTGVQEQSRQVQQVTQNIDQVADTAKQVAKKAKEAWDNAQKANETTQRGENSIENVKNGMHTIDENMKKLIVNSGRISEIVDVINGIAEQTNLLALNAAIEAARAGAHGRGFAVVAEEVRKLAELSSKATKEISQLISSIHKDTVDAVKASENGGLIVGDANQAFREIHNLVTRNADMVHEIVGVIRQIETSTEQVAGAAESISATTEESAAGIEEISASAEDMASVAAKLQTVVHNFKIS
ncbi:MAG: methyl-accepting chemotaxis protein, partial [Dehalobacterium sp.]